VRAYRFDRDAQRRHIVGDNATANQKHRGCAGYG
jgi:hypothetical protein